MGENISFISHTHKTKIFFERRTDPRYGTFTQIYDTDTTINISNVKFEDEVRKFYAFHMQAYTAKLVWMLFPYFPELIHWSLGDYAAIMSWMQGDITDEKSTSVWMM